MQVEQNIRVGDAAITVSEFCRHARSLLEKHFPLFWIGGEICNLTYASSGHIYFNLKDGAAQIRCTMWRNRAQLLAFRLTEGMQIEARALVSLYEARGDLQLNIESIRHKGQGSLFEQFLQLKEKLSREGLFAAERKRALPSYPRRVGIVTSPAAAALQDVIATFSRRSPHLELILYPAAVQGTGAGEKIAAAIALANLRAPTDQIDVLLVCRGGGSLEDLWAFNEEVVVRAIAQSALPVISGVGHETDFTLTDFVADLRATTPTAAAELLSTAFAEIRQRLQNQSAHLNRALAYRMQNYAQRLDSLMLRLVHPRQRLLTMQEQLHSLQQRLQLSIQNQLAQKIYSLRLRDARLTAVTPYIGGRQENLLRAQQRIHQAFQNRLKHLKTRLEAYSSHLDHLNPQAVLERGYAIVRNDQAKILHTSKGIKKDAQLHIQLAQGELTVRVEK